MREKLNELHDDDDHLTETDSRKIPSKEVRIIMNDEEIEPNTGYFYEKFGVSMKQLKGFILCVCSGILAVGWAAFSTLSMKPGTGRLTPYTAIFFIGIGISCTIPGLMTLLLYYPVYGKKGNPHDWVTDFTIKDHLIAEFAGFISLLALIFNFLGGDVVGFGISYPIIQINPLICTLFGVFVWKEFADTSNKVKILLAIMVLTYIIAICFIAASFLI